jgi:lysophospholipase L1-like esterase
MIIQEKMKRKIAFFTVLLSLVLTMGAKAQKTGTTVPTLARWTGTWATAQQMPVKSFMPYNNQMTFRSVRQIVKVSAGGSIVRLELSNIFSIEPVEIRSVYIAAALDSFRIDPSTVRYLRFHGRQRVVIEPYQSVISDGVKFDLRPLERVAITINYKYAPVVPTVHMGSRTTSYILKGYSGPYTDFSRAFRYEKWFNIAALDVYGPPMRTFAILGNSITDGKGSTTDQQNRWPDEMSEAFNRPLLSKMKALEEKGSEKTVHNEELGGQMAVLNLGIGNNRVLTVGYGQPGKNRFDRDILGQRGVTDVIIFEGINDLGTSRDGRTTARQLIEQYQLMIRKAHAKHLRVWLATITPMKGAAYYTKDHEQGRELVNRWIREQKAADGVIDFDEAMRDPADPQALHPGWRLPDCLHPNAEGYRQMGRYAAERIKKEVEGKPTSGRPVKGVNEWR